MVEQSDQEFVYTLRTAVAGYLQAVDNWEAAYNRHYRLPGYAQTVSSDMESEQRQYEAQHRGLSSMLPRAGQLCLKYGLANPFPWLLRSSLGQHAPQQRIESAVSRNERNAVATCLGQLADACRGNAPNTRPEVDPRAALPYTAPRASSRRSRVMLLAVIGGLVLFLAVRRPFSSVGFPAARNLDLQPYGKRTGDEIAASFEAERKRESARYTDADLQRMVEQLFVQDDPGRTNFHGLLYAGSRPVPFLLHALDDPRTWTTVFSKTAFDPIEMSPFGRICAILDAPAPASAVKPLTRYADHPDSMFRRQADSLLARIGTPQCLDPVKKALTDSDAQVREFTLMGLKGAISNQRRDEQFLSGVFPLLVPLLQAGTYDITTPAGLMMVIDPVKAEAILESKRYFAVRNPQLEEVVEALDHKGVKVPHEVLFPLLEQLEPLAAKESREEWTYAAALLLYANNPDDRAESRFRTLLDSPSSQIATTAARGLETLAGINAHDAVWDVYNKRGFAAMTKPQQFYYAVELYRDEVNNGGHNQYFYNDDSDLYPIALEGLRAMGSPTEAAILSQAASAFAPGQPAPTESARRNQLEQFGPDRNHLFETADQRFFSAEKEPGGRLDVLLTQYALQHRSDFAPPVEGSASGQLRR